MHKPSAGILFGEGVILFCVTGAAVQFLTDLHFSVLSITVPVCIAAVHASNLRQLRRCRPCAWAVTLNDTGAVIIISRRSSREQCVE